MMNNNKIFAAQSLQIVLNKNIKKTRAIFQSKFGTSMYLNGQFPNFSFTVLFYNNLSYCFYEILRGSVTVFNNYSMSARWI